MPAPYTKLIHELTRSKGLLRPVDLEVIGAPRVVLTRMIANGLLERVGRGLYRLSGSTGSEAESLALVATRAPKAVFCLLTALQFHQLTTQLPRRVWIAMPRGSHMPRIDYPPLTMVQLSGDAYGNGIEVHQRDQTSLRVYGIAKTIADCFKHRNLIGVDIALEALKDAQAQSKLNLDELWRYAKICRVTNIIRPYLEMLH
jgi:predicted transcriptional regulator of viral defense system